MKRNSILLSVLAALCLSVIGCGAPVGDPPPPPTEQVAEEGAPEGGVSEEEAGEGEVEALGKRCYATCSVVDVGAGSCPSSIGGYGYTTFLGGCNKACSKAQGDAASKLPAGCVINTCSFSGC